MKPLTWTCNVCGREYHTKRGWDWHTVRYDFAMHERLWHAAWRTAR